MFDNVVHQAPFLGCRGIDEVPRHQQLEGSFSGDVAAQRDTGSGTEKPEFDPRSAELGPFAGYRQVTSGDKLTACGGCGWMDACVKIGQRSSQGDH